MENNISLFLRGIFTNLGCSSQEIDTIVQRINSIVLKNLPDEKIEQKKIITQRLAEVLSLIFLEINTSISEKTRLEIVTKSRDIIFKNN